MYYQDSHEQSSKLLLKSQRRKASKGLSNQKSFQIHSADNVISYQRPETNHVNERVRDIVKLNSFSFIDPKE